MSGRRKLFQDDSSKIPRCSGLNLDQTEKRPRRGDLEEPSNEVFRTKSNLKNSADMGEGSMARCFLEANVRLFGGYRLGFVRNEISGDISWDKELFVREQPVSCQSYLASLIGRDGVQYLERFVRERLLAIKSGVPIDDEFEKEISGMEGKNKAQVKENASDDIGALKDKNTGTQIGAKFNKLTPKEIRRNTNLSLKKNSSRANDIEFVSPDQSDKDSGSIILSPNRLDSSFVSLLSSKPTVAIALYSSLLKERQILVHGDDLRAVRMVVRNMELLMFPFEWQGAYAPLLLLGDAHKFFATASPYLAGMATSEYNQIEPDITKSVVIDLNVLSFRSFHADVKALPAQVVDFLRSHMDGWTSEAELSSERVALAETIHRAFTALQNIQIGNNEEPLGMMHALENETKTATMDELVDIRERFTKIVNDVSNGMRPRQDMLMSLLQGMRGEMDSQGEATTSHNQTGKMSMNKTDSSKLKRRGGKK